MKKNIIRVSALLLAVIIMLCPLSVCFASENPGDPYISVFPQEATELAHEVIYYYIWVYLKSVGINIEYGDIKEFTGAINDWIENELLEWLDTIPSVSSIDALLFPWKFFWNPNGYLVGNQSFLDDMKEFTDWLINVFDLDDNETNQVESSGFTLGEYIFYSYPLVTQHVDSGRTYITSVTSSVSDVYYTWSYGSNPNNTQLNHFTVSHGNYTLTRDEYYNQEHYTSTQNNSLTYGDWKASNGYFYKKTSYGLESQLAYSLEDITSALSQYNSMTPYGDNIYILTNTINPPSSSDADGTNSIVITPSGNLYTPQDWDGTVHVDNLPAIVSTGTIANPGIQSVFLPIKSFITTFQDGFGLMTQLVYNLPSEIVGMALAIMGAIIIFGTIKIMKEH